MKRVILIILASISIPVYSQTGIQKIDTLYYDGEWKKAPHKAFAEYYRLALYPANTNEKKLFRDYYIDGSLFGKGCFLSIDSQDDSNSIFEGSIDRYYKNGKIQSHYYYSNGKLNGEFIDYFEDGLIRRKGYYKDGILDQRLTEFFSDGSYIQLEFSDGEAVNDYYVYGNPGGGTFKLNLSNDSLYWETPIISERKKVHRDGVMWELYSSNGIIVAETCKETRDYGKWYKIDVMISNDTPFPIEFDPSIDVSAFVLDDHQYPTLLTVWSSDEYLQKVKRSQNWEAIAVGISEGISAASAAYSTSTTTTSGSVHGSVSSFGYSSSSGSAFAYGSGGYAYGTSFRNGIYSGNSSFNVYGSSTSTTRTYDGAAAYQAQVIARKNISDFESAQWQERKAKEIGYLKKNTIAPGETISGYINIQHIDGRAMYNSIFIGDAEFKFSWNVVDDNDGSESYDGWNAIASYAQQQLDEIDKLSRINDKKANRKIKDFFVWFSQSAIREPRTVSRVYQLEQSYFNSLFSLVDTFISEGKKGSAESILEDIKYSYSIAPIQIKDVENRLLEYDRNGFSPRVKNRLNDSIYSN